MNYKKLFVLSSAVFFLLSLTSCANKFLEAKEIDKTKVGHNWYYFDKGTFFKVDLPQNAPEVYKEAWTESVRISSAAACPSPDYSDTYNAYAVVNRIGILAARGRNVKIYSDNSVFTNQTAGAMVFSKSSPVFYLYRSAFFNQSLLGIVSATAEKLDPSMKKNADAMRPFLVEFNSSSKICFPLVTYGNINLLSNEEVTGYFWNGKTWACSAKTTLGNKVSFKYFSWEPAVALTDLSPALSSNQFTFSNLSEGRYRNLVTPKLYSKAPKELKALVKHIPSSFPYYVSWRDNSGTSPISYYHPGNADSPINACGSVNETAGYNTVVFEDGTTFMHIIADENTIAFRLPKLPASYVYTDFFITENIMYIAWEESDFYKCGRAGFLTVNLSDILNALPKEK